MIDLHCHLDLYEDPLNVAREAAVENIFTLAVTTSPRAWIGTSKVFAKLSNIQVGLGLHPEILDRKIGESNLLLENIKHVRFVGEVGIDGSSRHQSTYSQQIGLFEQVVRECSKQGGRILSIHSRKAESKVLDILAQYPNVGVPILHWFSGSKAQLTRAIELGCWFSGGPAMAQSKNGLSLLKAIPLDRFLPESDGPFAQVSQEPIMPWQASNVCKYIADVRDRDEEEIRQIVIQNLDRLHTLLSIK